MSTPNLTLVVLSSKQIELGKPPKGCKYLLHVSTFDNLGLFKSRADALNKVDTGMFAFVDVGDYLLYIPTVVPSGLLYGDEHILIPNSSKVHVSESEQYTTDYHLKSAKLIHRAVCNTKVAKSVLKKIEIGEFQEWVLYYFIAAWKGAEQLKEPFYKWVRQETGLSYSADTIIQNSMIYLEKNKDRVLRELIDSESVE